MKNCIDRKCAFLIEADEYFFCVRHKLEIFNPENAGCGQGRLPALTLIKGGKGESVFCSPPVSYDQVGPRKASVR